LLTYKHESFIKECIESLLNQKTNFDYEIIIAEDFSPDRTAEICKSYAQKFPNKITLIKSEKNFGMIPNFIQGLKQCKGKYIAFCEGDDFWIDNKKLQKQVDFLEANPEYVVCYHNINNVDENSVITNASFINKESCRDYTSDELKKAHFMHLLSMCFRNVVSEFPKEFKGIIGGDMFLTSLLGKYGKGKYMENIGVGASYRIHSGGIWNSNDEFKKILFRANTLLAIYKYYKRIKEKESYSYFNDRYKWQLKEAIKIAKAQKNYKIMLKLKRDYLLNY
jgi:glycosyltransferase involved in cell wall biosynthesis